MDKQDTSGERIAKVLARAGVASRREAERLIEAGLVTVNGKVIDSPALNVTARDRIMVEGKPLPQREPARLWLYYKPLGLVTSASDEKGRDTVFDNLPEGLPRVMPVGRLDLNSEGLLLLTNDGGLKRRLELPSTGWLRKYRVRVNGRPEEATLEPLRQGITVDGEDFQPMTVSLDRQQGANAWLTVGLREGRNREIRRAMAAVGLFVNRLIRVSYGPFRLNELQPGEVQEVRAKVLRDQLGLPAEDEAVTPRQRPGAEEGARVPVKRVNPRAVPGERRVGRMEKPGTQPAAPEAPADSRKARRAARSPEALARARAERPEDDRPAKPKGPRKPRGGGEGGPAKKSFGGPRPTRDDGETRPPRANSAERGPRPGGPRGPGREGGKREDGGAGGGKPGGPRR
ncbi:pseudouridine synthase, partial [Solirhodobacter olei]|uniref:pseudouridine synthase n=1 Tax=Solirhodobacter olei TaxID=2493082 RepID=UPI000FD84D24